LSGLPTEPVSTRGNAFGSKKPTLSLAVVIRKQIIERKEWGESGSNRL
jgi:hypothetical protein